MKIDLRSDTVTKPTRPMLEAMFSAEVGDALFGEDPTVNALEEKAAKLFGKDAAIFCPSGTMTNQIAINVHTRPGDELICDRLAHIYYYEAGGISWNSGVSTCLINGNRGRITAEDVRANINPDDIHRPVTTLVEIENTMNKGGGSYYKLEEVKEISKVCRENSLALHLDGARFFNALAETGETTLEWGKYLDTVSICLSKGLGAPVGSLIIGNNEFIKRAQRVKKVMGGHMRQAGYLAAAGIYALDNHVGRLKEDHARAREIGKTLESLSYVEEVLPVDTNILIFKLSKAIPEKEFIGKLAEKNVLAMDLGPQTIRFVTHLDFTDEMLTETISVLKSIR
jgi:threonine aldolase